MVETGYHMYILLRDALQCRCRVIISRLSQTGRLSNRRIALLTNTHIPRLKHGIFAMPAFKIQVSLRAQAVYPVNNALHSGTLTPTKTRIWKKVTFRRSLGAFIPLSPYYLMAWLLYPLSGDSLIRRRIVIPSATCQPCPDICFNNLSIINLYSAKTQSFLCVIAS